MIKFYEANKGKLIAAFGVLGTAAYGVYAHAANAAGTLTATDTLPVVEGGIDSLKENLLAFLPVILPVAITLAIFFGAYYWIKGAGHRR